jgi:hypothetical protein
MLAGSVHMSQRIALYCIPVNVSYSKTGILSSYRFQDGIAENLRIAEARDDTLCLGPTRSSSLDLRARLLMSVPHKTAVIETYLEDTKVIATVNATPRTGMRTSQKERYGGTDENPLTCSDRSHARVGLSFGRCCKARC